MPEPPEATSEPANSTALTASSPQIDNVGSRTVEVATETTIASKTDNAASPSSILSDAIPERTLNQTAATASDSAQTRSEPASFSERSLAELLPPQSNRESTEVVSKSELIAPQSLPQLTQSVDVPRQDTQSLTHEQWLISSQEVSAAEEIVVDSNSSLSSDPAIADIELPLQPETLQPELETDSAVDTTPIVNLSTARLELPFQPDLSAKVETPHLDSYSTLDQPIHAQDAAEIAASEAVLQLAPLKEPETLEKVSAPSEISSEPAAIASSLEEIESEWSVEQLPEESTLTLPKDTSPIRLKPLSAPEPLTQLSNFLIPTPAEQQSAERSLHEATSEVATSADQRQSITPEDDAVSRYSTAPELNHSTTIPESWSSVAELLDESSIPTGKTSSQSQSFDRSSETSQLIEPLIYPSSNHRIQRLVSEAPNAINSNLSDRTPDEWSSLAELLNTTEQSEEARSFESIETAIPSPTASITPVETTSVTLTSPLVQTAPQIRSAQENQAGNKISSQDLEMLAQSVYRSIQMQLEIEQERCLNYTTGSPRWVSAAIVLPFNPASGSEKKQSIQESFELSASNNKLNALTQEIYFLLRQKLEIDRERQGLQSGDRVF